ncbi:MAG TPA: pyridoxal phosphate-dependent aminotransferase [Candidatus Sulfotelmatobacter sp.]|nr:pyridoxal phosphate-dependent aminotransferase [Candidatus Sulfotelmatobacter sp.]
MFSERTNWRLTQNRFTQAVEEVRARGVRVIDLTASNPTRVGLEYDAEAILRALRSKQVLDYDPQAKGLLSAREAVARYYGERCSRGATEVPSNVSMNHGGGPEGLFRVDPERVVLTASTSEGYSYVFRLLCNAGDELLVPKPSYPLFEFLADLQDVKLVPYPLIYDHGWQMDFHSMEKAVTARTRGVVVVHPNNPTGSYVHARELGALNQFCLTHGLGVIVDEVFLDYVLRDEISAASAVDLRSTGQPRAAVPIFSLAAPSFTGNQDVLTFTLSGLSKISALPQMKVAWVITSGPPEEVQAAMVRLEVIADTYLSMNAPVQWAMPVMLEQRRSIQRQLLERLWRNLGELDRQLAGQKTCERLNAEGGWYAVLRVPVTRSDEELAIQLVREKALLVHPGHFYDFDSDGYLVLSLIVLEADFEQGIQRLLEFVSASAV